MDLCAERDEREGQFNSSKINYSVCPNHAVGCCAVRVNADKLVTHKAAQSSTQSETQEQAESFQLLT